MCLVAVLGLLGNVQRSLVPLLNPALNSCGKLWQFSPDITPHATALHKDVCLESEWRLLT